MHYSTISGVSDNEKLALFLVLLLNFYVTISPISKIGLFIERKENGMAETRKLYYENGACLQFCATVLSCVPTDGNFAVTLDATAFYPEGGGQPADRGALGGARVLDVHEKDGVVSQHRCVWERWSKVMWTAAAGWITCSSTRASILSAASYTLSSATTMWAFISARRM